MTCSADLDTGVDPEAIQPAPPRLNNDVPNLTYLACICSLSGTDLDTGVDPEAIQPLIDYWDQARLLYAPFESNLYW